jgi:hypothetical protein
MEKSTKALWSYVAISIIAIELFIDFFLNQSPANWVSIRAVFVVINGITMVYLLYLRAKEKTLSMQR